MTAPVLQQPAEARILFDANECELSALSHIGLRYFGNRDHNVGDALNIVVSAALSRPDVVAAILDAALRYASAEGVSLADLLRGQIAAQQFLMAG